MTPEERMEFNKMKEELKAIKEGTDPVFIQAVKRYLDVASVESSTKLASSATQAVNEAGAGTYNVATPPDGFRQIDGFNFPYYN